MSNGQMLPPSRAQSNYSQLHHHSAQPSMVRSPLYWRCQQPPYFISVFRVIIEFDIMYFWKQFPNNNVQLHSPKMTQLSIQLVSTIINNLQIHAKPHYQDKRKKLAAHHHGDEADKILHCHHSQTNITGPNAEAFQTDISCLIIGWL